MRGPPFEAADEPDDVYPDGHTAAKAIETLRRLKDEPFFLAWVSSSRTCRSPVLVP